MTHRNGKSCRKTTRDDSDGSPFGRGTHFQRASMPTARASSRGLRLLTRFNHPQVLLHEEVGRTTECVVRVLHHSGWYLIGWIDLVLRPVVTIRLIVSREAVRTVTKSSGYSPAAVSAMRTSVARARLTILAMLTAIATCRVGTIVLGVVTFRPGVVSALIAEIVVVESRGNVKVAMAVLGFECVCGITVARQMITMHELTVSRRRANDRTLTLPVGGRDWNNRHCRGWRLTTNRLPGLRTSHGGSYGNNDHQSPT